MLEYIQLMRSAYEKKLLLCYFLLFSIVLLTSCSCQNTQVLDGEYYWINENRNEVAFVISDDIKKI